MQEGTARKKSDQNPNIGTVHIPEVMDAAELQKTGEPGSPAMSGSTRVGSGESEASDPHDSMESAASVLEQSSAVAPGAPALREQLQQTGSSEGSAEAPQDGGQEGGEAAGKGGPSLWIFVGQEVRVHLVDLLRTRLTAVPDASFQSMNTFFREMYAQEVKTDSLLAQLYVQHSGSKANTTLRACRRIRGTVTAFYNSGNGMTGMMVGDSASCGVELCFRVVVSVQSDSEANSGDAAGMETREFVVYRRWPISEFLALRKYYKRHHHVDVFVEKRASRDGECWNPTSAVDRFSMMRPDLLSKGESTDCDPFIVNGSALANPASSQGTGGDAAVVTPVKKRGRPRKYPRPEDTGAAVQGPPQYQLRPTGAPGGPQGTTVKEFGVRISVSDDIKSETGEEGVHDTCGEKATAEGRPDRPRRARGGVTNWKRRLGRHRSPR